MGRVRCGSVVARGHGARARGTCSRVHRRAVRSSVRRGHQRPLWPADRQWVRQRFVPSREPDHAPTVRQDDRAVAWVACVRARCLSIRRRRDQRARSLYPDNYIAVAASNSITQGTSPGTFSPERLITRAQADHDGGQSPRSSEAGRRLTPTLHWVSSRPGATYSPAHATFAAQEPSRTGCLPDLGAERDAPLAAISRDSIPSVTCRAARSHSCWTISSASSHRPAARLL